MTFHQTLHKEQKPTLLGCLTFCIRNGLVVKHFYTEMLPLESFLVKHLQESKIYSANVTFFHNNVRDLEASRGKNPILFEIISRPQINKYQPFF